MICIESSELNCPRCELLPTDVSFQRDCLTFENLRIWSQVNRAASSSWGGPHPSEHLWEMHGVVLIAPDHVPDAMVRALVMTER